MNRYLHNDCEGNLAIACVLRTNALLLVTNNQNLFKHSPVPTMTAEDAGRLLALE